jgi:serine protease
MKTNDRYQPPGEMLRILASRVRRDFRESAHPMTTEEAVAVLEKSGEEVVSLALRWVQSQGIHPPVYEFLAKHGREALGELVRWGDRGGAQATGPGLNCAQRVSLEALVALTGRPALPVKQDRIEFDAQRLGQWHTPLLLIKDRIPELTRAVGRVDLDGRHVGSAFLVTDEWVLTNRHVLEAIALPQPRLRNPRTWEFNHGAASVDFRRELGSPDTLKFKIVGVEFAGPDSTNTGDDLDFRVLDLAILRIERSNALGQTPPAPLRFLEGDLRSHASSTLLVVGYPGEPSILPADADGKVRQDVIEALARIFGLRYGVKYLSPGLVCAYPGEVRGDKKKWVLGHDATTLGGSSGSCVIRHGPVPAVIGLHFAGEFERANYAHAMARLSEGKHLPAALLEQLTWVAED